MNKPESSLDEWLSEAMTLASVMSLCNVQTVLRAHDAEYWDLERKRQAAQDALLAHLAAHPSNQVLQEPVAWMKYHSDGTRSVTAFRENMEAWAERGVTLTPLYASPQAVPSEQPIAEQPKSDKANLMVAVGSDLPPARAKTA